MSKRAGARRIAKTRRALAAKLAGPGIAKIKNDEQISIDLEELHRTGQTLIKGFRSDLYGPSSE